MEDLPRLEELEERLGHTFADRGRLLAALTHRSAAHETSLEDDYERLEFLGDAVLGLVAAEHLFRDLPEAREGELTRMKSRCVSAVALRAYADRIDLGAFLVLGLGEERSGGRQKDSLLADAMEAVFGAVYLDGGLGAVRRVAQPYLDLQRSQATGEADRDAKSALQELLQAAGIELPRYRVESEHGPAHDRTFVVEVLVQGRVAGRGRGGSKKAAETEAAAQALCERGWERA